ncbi:MAG: hypothetical protein Q4G07_01300 [Oscillospiraceae bacterium]|nr:hypothetical protein [Oscillospiraceae bacterium]
MEFELEIFETDIKYAENTILNINVCSNGFSAVTAMDIDIKGFAIFAKRLLELYQSLSGEAKLEEPYGSKYIEFEAATGGHIMVKGKLHNGYQNGHFQELYFENEFDQTYLQTFANELFAEHHHYLG